MKGASNKDADQTAPMRRLIYAFVVRIWYKTRFRSTWPNFKRYCNLLKAKTNAEIYKHYSLIY